VLHRLVCHVLALLHYLAEVGEGQQSALQQCVVSPAQDRNGRLVLPDHQFQIEVVLLQFLNGTPRVGLGALQGQHFLLKIARSVFE
jgi:hypothetical protein